jgi:phage protein D
MATPIFENQNFYAPYFEIKLRGQNLNRAVIRDVLEVSYSDSLDRLDSFEFTLHDWDPVLRLPKYSSPYDENGTIRKLPDNSPVPNFDPGAQAELRIGYYGPEEPRLMMTGQIVSLTPNFPASGAPTLRVRALSLLYTLQKRQETIVYENKKDSEIAMDIGGRLEIEVEIPSGQLDQETPNEYIALRNEYPIIFLMARARRLGYDIYVKLPEDDSDEEPKLFFGRTPTSTLTYELAWGKSLMQFSPTVKTKGQIAKVVVRGWNPLGQGEDRRIEGQATLQDLNPQLPDPQLLSSIDAALAETQEVVVDDPIRNQEEADRIARGILADKLKDLITGRGSTVGLPDLRAGRNITIEGLGSRFSGQYVVTESSHKLGSSGYTTEFSARMEGLSP